jgi:hypothetical protein
MMNVKAMLHNCKAKKENCKYSEGNKTKDYLFFHSFLVFCLLNKKYEAYTWMPAWK